jgi:adenylate cyclase
VPVRPIERKLAAIFAADIAGYSRLMARDEVGTLTRLKASRVIVDGLIASHRGRIFNTAGDSVVADFASAVDAVQCAVAVQKAIATENGGSVADEQMRFRIGVHVGDVMVDGENLLGDGVNIAARLENLAEPGAICVSAVVHEQVRDKLDIAFEDLGEQQVKNIARPVRAFRIMLGAPKPPGARVVALAPQAAPRMSIVVLPFLNLSSDPEQEYFVDAVTDDLTSDLTRIQDSFVIARTTAFTYKGKALDVKEIGRELGVRYVLEGSVRRFGEQVQVNAQLIDAATGAHVWADRFDTDRTNLAKAQADLTSLLARTLHLELVEAVGRQIEQEKPANLDARDLIMRGWAYYRPVSQANAQKALEAFEQALRLDTQSVDARVAIATILVENLIKRWSKSRQQDLARAEQLLLEALDRNRNHPTANASMGALLRVQGRLIESQIVLEKAVALDRNNAGAILHLGYTLNTSGQPERALPYFEKALQLSPRDQNIVYYYSGLGFCHLLQGHADEAIDFFRKAYAANSRIHYIPMALAGALGLRGDIDEATAALAEFLKLRPEVRSLADLRRDNPERNLWTKTMYAGLRLAGLPDE